MRRVTSVLAVFLLVALTANGQAQEPLPLEPGARVRVSAPDCSLHEQVTTFERLRSDTLVLLSAEGPVNCPVASVMLLEVRKSYLAPAATVVLFVGAGAGAALFLAQDDCFDLPGWACASTGAAIGAVGGFLLLLAAPIPDFLSTERWEQVPLGRLRVSFARQRDGTFALGLSVRF